MASLPEIVNSRKAVSAFNVVVICPRSWLLWRRKDRRVVVRLAREAGIVPVNMLLLRSNLVSAERLPSSVGIVPVRVLL